jgi:hypothetical protein
MTIAQFEEIFEGGTEEVDNHDIIVALLARPDYPGHAGATHQSLVNLGLVLQWTVLLLHGRLQLDCHFFARHCMNSIKDGSWTTAKCIKKKEKVRQERGRTTATNSELFLETILATKGKVHTIKSGERWVGETQYEKRKEGERPTYYIALILIIQIGDQKHSASKSQRTGSGARFK